LNKEVEVRDKVKADIEIYNLGDEMYVDILLHYAIKDFRGNLLAFKEESLAIKDVLNLERDIRVPRGAEYGAHVFYVKVSYGEVSAVSTDSFMVIEEVMFSPIDEPDFLYLVLLLIFLILVTLLYLIRRRKYLADHSSNLDYPTSY